MDFMLCEAHSSHVTLLTLTNDPAVSQRATIQVSLQEMESKKEPLNCQEGQNATYPPDESRSGQIHRLSTPREDG